MQNSINQPSNHSTPLNVTKTVSFNTSQNDTYQDPFKYQPLNQDVTSNNMGANFDSGFQ